MGTFIDVNVNILKRIEKERLNLDQLYILECIVHKDYDTLAVYDEGFTKERVLLNYQKLIRVGLLEDNKELILTPKGVEFYRELVRMRYGSVIDFVEVSKKDSKDWSKEFETWWNTYPATANWVSSAGRKFESGRSLRSGSKADNKREFCKVMNEGHISFDELLKCLDYEINAKKKQSVNTGTNHLQFMKGSLTYLRQRAFEGFLDIIRTGDGIDEEVSNWDLA